MSNKIIKTKVLTAHLLRGHARDIMRNIADLTMEQSEKHLSLAQGAAHLTKRLISSNVVGSEQSRQDMLERYFLDQLAIYPHFAGIYFGSANGDFFYVNRSDMRSANGFRTKIIKYKNGQRTTRLIWRDANQNLLAREENPADTYDPRQRPWFIKASKEKAIVWTDPYIFYTSQKPGITIAGPVYQQGDILQGIVGVDIEIDQLSEFIGKLRIGKHGRAFMLNNNGDVVAFSDVTKLKHKDEGHNKSLRLVKIEELDDGLSRAAFGALDWGRTPEGRLRLQKSKFARFIYEGEPYHAEFTPFKNNQWPWIIGVYLPENDYLGGLKQNRRFNMGLTLFLSAVVTLLGIWLAGGIIRPLGELEKAALAIRHQDFQHQPRIHTIFSEIQETSDSFVRMQASLIDSEDKYRRIFENIQDIYYESTLNGEILEVSPSVESVSGYRRDELIGRNMTDLHIDPKGRDKFLRAIQAEGKVSNYEAAIRNKSGQTEYCSVSASLKYDKQGNPQKVVGSVRVITDSKMAALELQRYQSRLEDLVRERTRDLQ
ncbi:MAG: cache domain-containing protein, partial [Desulfosarcinaceae bacterium]